MKSRKIIRILSLAGIAASLYCCKTEEIILHGEISGFVTDTTNSQPLQAIPVKLTPINDTTSTASDGIYVFKSLIPGDYKIEISKPPYAKGIRNAVVTSANITVVNFAMHKISYPEFSDKYLDFGLDSILKYFTIRNKGTGKLNYSLITSQDWITVNPNIGEATNETDTFKVTINRTGLSEKKQLESIVVVSHVGLDLVRDTIYVLLNGVLDRRDFTYYGIIKIGSQTWMAENLNIGEMHPINRIVTDSMTNNEILEKYCIDNLESNCNIFGGLYMWAEMMQYKPSENGPIGTAQGVCMDAWHIPTLNEWDTLFYFLGGYKIQYPNGDIIYKGGVGGKLKDTGLLWRQPNVGATNEIGFSALPGGNLRTSCDDDFSLWCFGWIGQLGSWWSSTRGFHIELDQGNTDITINYFNPSAFSVRCIKDPAKK